MPATEARAALVTQECAHMNKNHAARLLKTGGLRLERRVGFTIGRVNCLGIDGSRFVWEALEACGLCGTTGSIIGHDSKAYDCPNCRDLASETFETDYDGQLVGE